MTKAEETLSRLKAILEDAGVGNQTRKPKSKANAIPPMGIDELHQLIKEKFCVFHPNKDADTVFPKRAGNYIFLLKKDEKLPMVGIVNLPVVRTIEIQNQEYQIVYTGIATDDLRQRVAGKHFNGGNAGRSTLRLSLGCLMGMTKIPRDKEVNSHYKFREVDEAKLTKWMCENMIVLYLPYEDFDDLEGSMIATLNPPLNLDKNHNAENKTFRDELKYLRSRNVNFKEIRVFTGMT